MDNGQIADAFNLVAKLMDVNGENSFRVKTYSSASFNIDKEQKRIADLSLNEIAAIKGVGSSTAQKVFDFIHTGKLDILEEYIAKTPPGIIEMLSIKGIGPKKINVIWKEMGIESVGELLYACNENRLTMYKGFGEKTQNNIREALEYFISKKGFFLYAEAVPFYNEIAVLLDDHFTAVGEYVRQLEIIESLDFVVSGINNTEVKNKFQALPFLFVSETGNELIYQIENGPKIKCIVIESTLKNTEVFKRNSAPEFIALLGENYPHLDTVLKETVNDKAVFTQLGIAYLPPYLREVSNNALQLARANKLPTVITNNDIRGIIHSHSTWSDGANTLEEMALYAQQTGLEYLVISDHSKSAFYANGLQPERILSQHAEIENLNKKLNGFKIFKSIESDILIDGSLDYDDQILASFDLVIASVHSVLKMDETKAVNRLIKAIENPYTNILGHMTGRLLLSRPGYPVNHDLIIDACAANNVVIELNAHPRRLDIDWRFLTKALDKGVLTSINPDAHSVEGYKDTRYGVFVAQKALLTANKNLSSFTLSQMEAFIVQQHAKR